MNLRAPVFAYACLFLAFLCIVSNWYSSGKTDHVSVSIYIASALIILGCSREKKP